ncbi:hypothetical protein SAMN04488564_1011026 [Lentzea waywayandensis]|uniref:Uncharacterized protein n=1 Tax=Lentzea waywayandensis TaxID=84724 RepID=A0A1I6D4B1_9PSEU|nr:hypothetical protein SAMN04488564_1011026 [Lentzea waywayandensis]
MLGARRCSQFAPTPCSQVARRAVVGRSPSDRAYAEISGQRTRRVGLVSDLGVTVDEGDAEVVQDEFLVDSAGELHAPPPPARALVCHALPVLSSCSNLGALSASRRASASSWASRAAAWTRSWPTKWARFRRCCWPEPSCTSATRMGTHGPTTLLCRRRRFLRRLAAARVRGLRLLRLHVRHHVRDFERGGEGPATRVRVLTHSVLSFVCKTVTLGIAIGVVTGK